MTIVDKKRKNSDKVLYCVIVGCKQRQCQWRNVLFL